MLLTILSYVLLYGVYMCMHTHMHMQLCIVLNNMQHIRQEMSKFEEKLELQSFYDWLEEEEKVGNRCKELVQKLLGSADEDIYNKMSKIMTEITEKVYMYSILIAFSEGMHVHVLSLFDEIKYALLLFLSSVVTGHSNICSQYDCWR